MISNEVVVVIYIVWDKFFLFKVLYVNLRVRVELIMLLGWLGILLGFIMLFYCVVIVIVKKIDVVLNIKDMGDF